MFKWVLPILLACLASTPALAQLEVKKQYDEGTPIEATIKDKIPDGGKIRAIWDVSSKEVGKTAYHRQHTETSEFIWAIPGVYEADVIVVILDSDNRFVDLTRYKEEFTVLPNGPKPPPNPNPGPNPPPNPGPNPPPPTPTPTACDSLPEDRFGNIARQVCKLSSNIAPEIRLRGANLYAEVALKLETGAFLDINKSNPYLLSEKAKIPELTNVFQQLDAIMQNNQLVRTNKNYLIEYYRCVALGLKGA